MKSSLLLPPSSEVFRGAIVGVSGTGKSNAGKEWCAREMAAGRNVVAFDPEDEWSQGGRPSKRRKLGPLTARMSFEQFAQSPEVLEAEGLALAVVPSDDPDLAAEECAELCGHVMAMGGLVLVLEEVGGYAFDGAGAAAARKAINFVFTRGRHREVTPLALSQRLVHVPLTSRAQVNALQVFCQTDPDDLSAIDKRTNPENFSERVANLPAGESLIWLDPLTRGAQATAKDAAK